MILYVTPSLWQTVNIKRRKTMAARRKSTQLRGTVSLGRSRGWSASSMWCCWRRDCSVGHSRRWRTDSALYGGSVATGRAAMGTSARHTAQALRCTAEGFPAFAGEGLGVGHGVTGMLGLHVVEHVVAGSIGVLAVGALVVWARGGWWDRWRKGHQRGGVGGRGGCRGGWGQR